MPLQHFWILIIIHFFICSNSFWKILLSSIFIEGKCTFKNCENAIHSMCVCMWRRGLFGARMCRVYVYIYTETELESWNKFWRAITQTQWRRRNRKTRRRLHPNRNFNPLSIFIYLWFDYFTLCIEMQSHNNQTVIRAQFKWYSDLEILRKPCMSNQDRGKAVLDDEEESEDPPTEQIRCLTLHSQNSPKLGIEIDSMIISISFLLFTTETLVRVEIKRWWSICNFNL